MSDMTDEERRVAEGVLAEQGRGWAGLGQLCRAQPNKWLRYWRNPHNVESLKRGLMSLGPDFEHQVWRAPQVMDLPRSYVILVRYSPATERSSAVGHAARLLIERANEVLPFVDGPGYDPVEV